MPVGRGEEMRSLGIVALGAAVSSNVAAQSPAPHPNSIAAELSAPGHHVPNSVGLIGTPATRQNVG